MERWGIFPPEGLKWIWESASMDYVFLKLLMVWILTPTAVLEGIQILQYFK